LLLEGVFELLNPESDHARSGDQGAAGGWATPDAWPADKFPDTLAPARIATARTEAPIRLAGPWCGGGCQDASRSCSPAPPHELCRGIAHPDLGIQRS
jgi:hypothetical protein